jgi:hypothetical protein
MNLKYKKAILLILLSTSGIGMLTVSIAPNSKLKDDSKAAATDVVSLSVAGNTEASSGAALSDDLSITPTQVLTPTPTLAPTPLPVYDLEDKENPEIETLIKNYYDAKISCDLDKMKELMSNPDNVPTKKQMKKDIMYIEEYKNIKCYTKKSFEEGTYIVYIYYEIKFLNIKTPAPAVKKFFLITDDTGKIKIFSDKMDEETEEYYTLRDEDTDVQKLIDKTNNKSDKAKKKDEYLKIFWEQLEKSHNNN